MLENVAKGSIYLLFRIRGWEADCIFDSKGATFLAPQATFLLLWALQPASCT